MYLQGSIYSTSPNVHWGVPQGCVLSPYLLAVRMRSLQLANPANIMTKYAGDVVILLPYINEKEAQHKLAAEEANISN